MSVHHYMVDYENDAGEVLFANETYLYDLVAAKALAAKTAKEQGGAYVVAYEPDAARAGTFTGIGYIHFAGDGKESHSEGVIT